MTLHSCIKNLSHSLFWVVGPGPRIRFFRFAALAPGSQPRRDRVMLPPAGPGRESACSRFLHNWLICGAMSSI